MLRHYNGKGAQPEMAVPLCMAEGLLHDRFSSGAETQGDGARCRARLPWMRDKFWAGLFGRWDGEDAEDADGGRRGHECGGADFGGEPAGDFLVFA